MAHPRMYDDSSPALKRLRKICMALPEAFEKEAWGECTYRVTGGSMFAMTDCNHHDSGHIAVWIKAPPMVQEILTNADAKRFFIPPYVGPKGWVGVRLDYKVDWDELDEILKDGYLMSAPKRLRARIESAAADEAPAAGVVVKNRSAGASKAATARTAKPTARTKPQHKEKIRAAKR